MTTDLTTGRVSRVILTFSLPLLLSTMRQQFYNIADSMIVGQFTGSGGLAAIGAAYPVTLFFVAIATGASMGTSVVMSQLFGAGKKDTLHKACLLYTSCPHAPGWSRPAGSRPRAGSRGSCKYPG